MSLHTNICANMSIGYSHICGILPSFAINMFFYNGGNTSVGEIVLMVVVRAREGEIVIFAMSKSVFFKYL